MIFFKYHFSDTSKNQVKKTNGPVAGKGVLFANFKQQAAKKTSESAVKKDIPPKEESSEKEATIPEKEASNETVKPQVNGVKDEVEAQGANTLSLNNNNNSNNKQQQQQR